MNTALLALSNELAGAVEQAAPTVVTVNARARSGSSGVHWRPGVIVTADHTIRQEDDITIGLPGGGSVRGAPGDPVRRQLLLHPARTGPGLASAAGGRTPRRAVPARRRPVQPRQVRF